MLASCLAHIEQIYHHFAVGINSNVANVGVYLELSYKLYEGH